MKPWLRCFAHLSPNFTASEKVRNLASNFRLPTHPVVFEALWFWKGATHWNPQTWHSSVHPTLWRWSNSIFLIPTGNVGRVNWPSWARAFAVYAYGSIELSRTHQHVGHRFSCTLNSITLPYPSPSTTVAFPALKNLGTMHVGATTNAETGEANSKRMWSSNSSYFYFTQLS